MYPLPALLTPLPHIHFATQEIAGCTNEAANSAKKVPRNLFLFSMSCFTGSVTPSINTPESSSDFCDFNNIQIFIQNEQSNFFSCSHSSFFAYFPFKFVYCIRNYITY